VCVRVCVRKFSLISPYNLKRRKSDPIRLKCQTNVSSNITFQYYAVILRTSGGSAERVKVTLNRELWIMVVSRREEGIRYQLGEIRVRRRRPCSLIHGAAVTVAPYFAFHENVFVCLSSPECDASALKYLPYACTRICARARARAYTTRTPSTI